MEIGKLGVWALTNEFSAPDAAAFARRVEAWGYKTLWTPEAVGRCALVGSSWMLANTSKLQLATGICNIYARDPYATLNAQYGLAEQSGGRFLLGLGVSHAPLIEGLRGHVMQKPIPLMTSYLEAMAKHVYVSPPPAEKPKTVLAALGDAQNALTRFGQRRNAVASLARAVQEQDQRIVGRVVGRVPGRCHQPVVQLLTLVVLIDAGLVKFLRHGGAT